MSHVNNVDQQKVMEMLNVGYFLRFTLLMKFKLLSQATTSSFSLQASVYWLHFCLRAQFTPCEHEVNKTADFAANLEMEMQKQWQADKSEFTLRSEISALIAFNIS